MAPGEGSRDNLYHSAYDRAMADSRTKGATFERDVVKRINAFAAENSLGFSCKRNLNQYQSKDLCDIEIPGHAVECKAYKSGWWFAPAWWDQVCASCGDKTPILIYKFNNKPIRVVVPLYAINQGLPRDNARTAVVSLAEWFAILSETLAGQEQAA